MGDIQSAEKYLRQAEQIAQESNNRLDLIFVLEVRIVLKSFQGNFLEGREVVYEAMALVKSTDDLLFSSLLQLRLGFIEFGLGNVQAGVRSFYRSIRGIVAGAQVNRRAELVYALAMALAHHEKQLERAVELTSVAINHPIFARWNFDPEAKKLIPHLKSVLAPDVYESAWERGKSLELEMVLQELLDEFGDNQ